MICLKRHQFTIMERLGRHMEKAIDVNKAEDVVKIITELLGGLRDDEELYVEIEVKQIDGKDNE